MDESFLTRVPRSSTEVRRVFIHDIKLQVSGSRNSKVIREMITLTVRMKHEDDYGMNGDSNLSHSVRTSKQGRQSRDDDTN